MNRDFRTPFSVGMLITLIGAFADTIWHLNGWASKEGFFTPAHATLYGGVFVMTVSVYLLRNGKLKLPISFGSSVKTLMLVGILLMLGGGVFDFWWHTTFGLVDVVAWTAPHMTTTAGFVTLLATAVVSLSKNSTTVIKAFFALSLTLFVALWTAVILLTS